MQHPEKAVLMKMFLDKKNMTYEQCSKNQKKVFNDWPPQMWEMYDWEFLSDKRNETENNSK